MTTDANNANVDSPIRPSLGRFLLQRFLPGALLAGSSGMLDFDVEGAGEGPPSPWPSPADSGVMTPVSESLFVQDLKEPRSGPERRGRTRIKKREIQRQRQRHWEKRLVSTPEILSSRSPSSSRDMTHPDPAHSNTFESEPCSTLQTPAASQPNFVTELKTTRKIRKSRLPSVNITLQNSGAVARDHLASERTFLSYTRTSLAMASMGVALVQLFTITDLMSQSTGVRVADRARTVQQFAKPLGLTMVLFAMVVLGVGAYRYFLIQCFLPEGKFPVARVSIVTIASVLGAVVVVVFAALLNGRG